MISGVHNWPQLEIREFALLWSWKMGVFEEISHLQSSKKLSNGKVGPFLSIRNHLSIWKLVFLFNGYIQILVIKIHLNHQKPIWKHSVHWWLVLSSLVLLAFYSPGPVKVPPQLAKVTLGDILTRGVDESVLYHLRQFGGVEDPLHRVPPHSHPNVVTNSLCHAVV